MVPASPVLIPCFREADSRLQKEGGVEETEVSGSGSEGFTDAMRGLYAAYGRGGAPSLSRLVRQGGDFDYHWRVLTNVKVPTLSLQRTQVQGWGTRSSTLGDPTAADHNFSVVEDRRLPWRNRPLRLVERREDFVVASPLNHSW